MTGLVSLGRLASAVFGGRTLTCTLRLCFAGKPRRQTSWHQAQTRCACPARTTSPDPTVQRVHHLPLLTRQAPHVLCAGLTRSPASSSPVSIGKRCTDAKKVRCSVLPAQASAVLHDIARSVLRAFVSAPDCLGDAARLDALLDQSPAGTSLLHANKYKTAEEDAGAPHCGSHRWHKDRGLVTVGWSASPGLEVRTHHTFSFPCCRTSTPYVHTQSVLLSRCNELCLCVSHACCVCVLWPCRSTSVTRLSQLLTETGAW